MLYDGDQVAALLAPGDFAARLRTSGQDQRCGVASNTMTVPIVTNAAGASSVLLYGPSG
jgi:hypothetical protein